LVLEAVVSECQLRYFHLHEVPLLAHHQQISLIDSDKLNTLTKQLDIALGQADGAEGLFLEEQGLHFDQVNTTPLSNDDDLPQNPQA
jgi:hypothetical protein